MYMQNNNTHKLYEDKLDKFVETVMATPTNTTNGMDWQRMQQQLQAHHNKIRNKKLLALLLLLFTIATITAVLLPTKNNTTTTNNTIANNKLPTTTTNNKATTIIETSKTLGNQTINTDNGNTTTLYNNTVTNKTTVQLNTIPNQTVTDKAFYQKNIKSEANISIVSNKKNNNNNKNQNHNSLLTNNESSTAINNENLVDNSVENDDINIYTNNLQHAIVTNNYTTTTLLTTLTIPLPKYALKSSQLPKVKRVKVKAEAPEHEFTNEKHYYVETFTGFNNSRKDKNSFGSFLAPAGYNNKRLTQENALQTLQAGVQIKMRKNHLTLTSGLTYMQLGDRVNYDSISTGSFAISANGSTNFTYIEIPLLAGYEWANKRWGFTLQGGVSTGLLTGLSGKYVSIANYNTNLFDVNENKTTFKKQIFNLIVTPQLNYFVSSKINLFVSPSYRRNLQPITANTADLKQKYNTLGFSIGIRSKL